MKNYILLIFLFFSFHINLCLSKSFVVRSSENQETEKSNNNLTSTNNEANPKIYSMSVLSNITNRFATTLITSKVKNFKNVSEETTFTVVLPKSAFISKFSMEIDGKTYEAYVKEKEEAKQIYNEARRRGQSAAKVEANARDSNIFTVSVNIEPESKTIFRLTYEELLQRELDRYEFILNIHPGQIVDDLDIEVRIAEGRPLKFVKTPSLRTGNEISKSENENLNPQAEIEHVNATSAVVKFKPDKQQQAKFAEFLNVKSKENGMKGQFVVQYDVERDPKGGEVLVNDGYFVHFFAPEDLEPIPKHVVFVLDHSGSMLGRKMIQLIEAMQNILSELKPEDVFNLVRFSDEALVWDNLENVFNVVNIAEPSYGNLKPILSEKNLPGPIKATKENIEKAKNIIKHAHDLGSTNIIAGLEVGHFLLTNSRKNSTLQFQPMIIFLTDGQPNVGIRDRDQITKIITKVNSESPRASIYSLSFGDYADKEFLQKLSSANLGFSRHIYEAADASLQLQDFYKKISSPLLSDVEFKYVDDVSEVTKLHHPIYFKGSEIVIAGRIRAAPVIGWNSDQLGVNCFGTRGRIHLKPVVEESRTKLERLWAYLTVKKLLEKSKDGNNATELKKHALDLSLKYSFVTEVSSLVVVKPNQTTNSSPFKLVDAGRWRGPTSSGSGPFYRTGSQWFSGPGSSGSGSYAMSHGSSGVRGYIYPPPNRFYQSPSMHRPARPKPISNWTTTTKAPPTADIDLLNQTIARIEELTNKTGELTTPQGVFKFGLPNTTISVRPKCANYPNNGTEGICTLLYECPTYYYPHLEDTKKIVDHFCPLENQYAGVCCGKESIVKISQEQWITN